MGWSHQTLQTIIHLIRIQRMVMIKSGTERRIEMAAPGSFSLPLFIAVSQLLIGGMSQEGDALKLLRHLKEEATAPYIFRTQIPGLVKKSDLPSLVALLSSTEKCMPVALEVSSVIRLESTVGDEAAFMIEGFREGRYPPGLNSRAYSVKEKAELRQWVLDLEQVSGG